MTTAGLSSSAARAPTWKAQCPRGGWVGGWGFWVRFRGIFGSRRVFVSSIWARVWVCVCVLVDWLVGWLVGWLIGWLVGWLVGRLGDWMADRLGDWMVGWMDGWLDTFLWGEDGVCVVCWSEVDMLRPCSPMKLWRTFVATFEKLRSA